MANEASVQFSAKDQETLEHLADLLHLFHHRNKNQHRRSVWWRHFSVFRRQLSGLIEEVRKINEVPTTHLERTRKKIRDKETQDCISHRLFFWQGILLPKWQHVFSQIIADGRFAVLGLVLLAILAETCQVAGITATIEDLGQAEVEKVLDEFSKEPWEDDSAVMQASKTGGEDVGEVVTRPELGYEGSSGAEAEGKSEKRKNDDQMKQGSKIITAKPLRRKRKRVNAIDDLFSGLD